LPGPVTIPILQARSTESQNHRVIESQEPAVVVELEAEPTNALDFGTVWSLTCLSNPAALFTKQRRVGQYLVHYCTVGRSFMAEVNPCNNLTPPYSVQSYPSSPRVEGGSYSAQRRQRLENAKVATTGGPCDHNNFICTTQPHVEQTTLMPCSSPRAVICHHHGPSPSPHKMTSNEINWQPRAELGAGSSLVGMTPLSIAGGRRIADPV
jgi:hypothetical protein